MKAEQRDRKREWITDMARMKLAKRERGREKERHGEKERNNELEIKNERGRKWRINNRVSEWVTESR